MTLFKHELRQNRIALAIWTAAISFMLGICVLIYPEMSSQMGDISKMFADMGSFSSAFGMDQLNFGEFMGYFGVECGNVLGLGGAFFAAITGITLLAKEEKEHTADFLFPHPISRVSVITSKYLSMVAQIVILNATVILVTTVSILAIQERPDIKAMALLYAAYFVLQIEIGTISFGISAFLKGNGLGVGLGLSFILYFLNIVSNLTEDAKFLKYITPFGYAEGSYIIPNNSIEWKYMAVGIAFIIIGIAAAYIRYSEKDIS